MLVQRYVKTPLLLDGKKFDLRLYVLIKGYDPVEAYLADEGLVRVCTENYRMPNPQNMKNMFMHLTNFCLNKTLTTTKLQMKTSRSMTTAPSVCSPPSGKL